MKINAIRSIVGVAGWGARTEAGGAMTSSVVMGCLLVGTSSGTCMSIVRFEAIGWKAGTGRFGAGGSDLAGCPG